MKKVIDLTPYLPAAESEPAAPHGFRLADLAAAAESVVTLLIGAGFVTVLVAFFAAII